MTSEPELRRQVELAHAATGRLLERLTEARRNMVNAQGGFPPGQGFDGGGPSDRYETVWMPDEEGVQEQVKVRVPTNDRVGETVAREQADDASTDLADTDKLVKRIAADVTFVDRLFEKWATKTGPRGLGDLEDLWCVSCHRDHKHCEPVSDRYKGLCRWCGSYKGEYGHLPPLALLERRHRGERITQQMVQQHERRKAG